MGFTELADLSDVEVTFVGVIAGAIYPNGTSSPSAILNGSTPVDCAVVRGWPNKTTLQANLALGRCTVSVYPVPGSGKNTTRFNTDWQIKQEAAPTIVGSIVNNTIVLAGTSSSPQNVAAKVNGKAYLYAVQPSDTLATIATALATAINADTPATSVGAIITVPAANALGVAIGGFGLIWRELRRQEEVIMVTVWAPTPELRDLVAPFVDLALQGLGQPRVRQFLSLPDGSAGRMLFMRSTPTDKDELSAVFRRDIVWSVEYPTTEVQTAAQIVVFETILTPNWTDPASPTLQLVA